MGHPLKLTRPLICLVAFCSAAQALDVVVLKTGAELRGEIIGRSNGAVHLDLLPGQTALLAENIKEIKREDNPQWYLERIKGHAAITAMRILDSALRSGCLSKPIQNKYVESCVGAADNLLADGQPARAAETCSRALLFRPHDAGADRLLKRARAAERRAAAEMRALQGELEKRPGNDYARFMLAETYRRLGRDAAALAEYRKIIAGKVGSDEAGKTADQLRAFIRANLRIEDSAAPPAPRLPAGRMQKAELPGFEIHFCDPDLGRDLIMKLPVIARLVAADLECGPPAACTIRILRTREEFVAATGNVFGDGYSSGKCVWTYHGASAILENVIPHELAHVMLGQAVGRIPRWLDEGLAVRQEAGAGAYWQKLRDSKPMAVGELLAGDDKPKSKDDNNRFYASAYGFVDMLIQLGGMKKIRRLVEALKTSSAERAFRDVYGVRSLQDLESKWATYLQD